MFRADLRSREKSFDVDAAWTFHERTRERNGDPRETAMLIRQKRELQEHLDAYRNAVSKDFGFTLSTLEQPEVFTRDEKKLFAADPLHPRPDGKWYGALERMRAYELKKNFEAALEDIMLPKPLNQLECTDVGSRSNFFSSLMSGTYPTKRWKSVDIQEFDLPSMARRNGDHSVIEPFAPLPKSDVITLNCVLHHVGEDEREAGKYDNAKTGKFIDTVRDALPADGLVVVTEDFIGKEKIEPAYNNFIKGIDALFYPKAPGNQKPSHEWIKIFEERGFSLEKEAYPVTFNVAGFPVVESVLVFRKTGKT